MDGAEKVSHLVDQRHRVVCQLAVLVREGIADVAHDVVSQPLGAVPETVCACASPLVKIERLLGQADDDIVGLLAACPRIRALEVFHQDDRRRGGPDDVPGLGGLMCELDAEALLVIVRCRP